MKLVEIEPGRFRFVRPTIAPARSDLPCPNVISDAMDPTEQVDGRFYTSKAAFRRVGKQLGLTEIGNEKIKPLTRATARPETKAERRVTLKKALDKFKAGHRVRRAP